MLPKPRFKISILCILPTHGIIFYFLTTLTVSSNIIMNECKILSKVFTNYFREL